MNPTLLAFCDEVFKETSALTPERISLLEPLIDYIQKKRNDDVSAQLVFICTHNSRRSHLAQVWSHTAAAYFHVPNIHCYSGGTEVTAVHPSTLRALSDAGFDIAKTSEGDNPVYLVDAGSEVSPITCFSKTYDHPQNPASHFVAVMTCDHAEENCPYIPGAASRFSITYEDPKIADGTAAQLEVYAQRSRQIAREMFFVFANIR